MVFFQVIPGSLEHPDGPLKSIICGLFLFESLSMVLLWITNNPAMFVWKIKGNPSSTLYCHYHVSRSMKLTLGQLY